MSALERKTLVLDSDGKNLQAYRGTIGFLNDWGSDFTTERRLCWKEGVAEDGRLCVIAPIFDDVERLCCCFP